MYEYKKVNFSFTGSNLSSKKIDKSADEMMIEIEKEAKDGWRFVQALSVYSVSSTVYLIFERKK